MKKYLLAIFLFASLKTVSGQSIEALEYDLSWHLSSETYGNKIGNARKLLEMDPFNYQAIQYICRYYNDRKIDSVSIFFDHLTAKYQSKPEPFLLRAEFFIFEYKSLAKDDYNKQKIKYLNSALTVDKTNRAALFKLAETYYKDFIFPLKKEKDFGFKIIFDDDPIDSTSINNKIEIKEATFQYAADSALAYYYKLWNIDKEIRDIIYFPIRQLECYLKIADKSPISPENEEHFECCYFPSWFFANIRDNWQCDHTIDYLIEIESSKRTGKTLQMQLSALKEPCLYGFELPANSVIYRFTWLRSFDNPISIRIEKNGDKIMLYWKAGKGAGGYEPTGIKNTGKKKLSKKKWDKFVNFINEANFSSLPNEKYMPMTDGATWTIERKNSSDFKVHHTNCPDKEVKEACLFLLKRTNIKINDDEIY